MLKAADSREARRLEAAHRLLSILAGSLDLDVSIRLWDGTRIPLSEDVSSPYEVVVESAAVLSSLIRRPTRDNLLLHYANGALAIEGGLASRLSDSCVQAGYSHAYRAKSIERGMTCHHRR